MCARIVAVVICVPVSSHNRAHFNAQPSTRPQTWRAEVVRRQGALGRPRTRHRRRGRKISSQGILSGQTAKFSVDVERVEEADMGTEALGAGYAGDVRGRNMFRGATLQGRWW